MPRRPTLRRRYAAATLLLVGGCGTGPATDAPEPEEGPAFEVAGTGIHFFSSQILHSEEPTASGMIHRSSDIVRLEGDLDGYVLYHPVAEFDLEAGTLVNTGRQYFSGTVAGSEPVLLHDDRFRFDVDLETGESVGSVHFTRSRDAPPGSPSFSCDLDITGTGDTPEGDATVTYRGTCRATG
jgi:hypothetical protein